VFAFVPAYTRRSNPCCYYNIRGPQFFNIDATLSKEFSITEKYKFQLRMESYNFINNANVNNPNMSLSSSLFGKSSDIYPQAYGRRLQLGCGFGSEYGAALLGSAVSAVSPIAWHRAGAPRITAPWHRVRCARCHKPEGSSAPQ
jgi:hypothetical protein